MSIHDLSMSSSSAPTAARAERADASAIARLLEVSSRCARADNDISECLDGILEAAIAMIGADKGNLQIFDRESATLAIAAQRGFEEPFLNFFANVRSGHPAVCGAAMSAADRIIVEDVTQSDIFRGEPALDVLVSANVRAVQSTPLVSSRGEVVGVISTHFTQPHRPDERDLGFIDLLARQAADLIERNQAQSALRESEEKYRTLFETIDEGFAIMEVIRDDQGRAIDLVCREFNQAVERHSGARFQLGRRVRDMQPKVEDHWFERYDRVSRSGVPAHEEAFDTITNRWYRMTLTSIGGAGSPLVSLVFSDITPHKRAEAALRESEARQAFLLKLTDAMRPLDDAMEIMAAAMRVLGEHLHVRRVQYFEADASEEYLETIGGYTDDGAPARVGRFRIAELGRAVASSFHAARTVAVADFRKDPRIAPAELPAYETRDFRAFVAVPLSKRGRLVAMLGVVDAAVRQWTPDDVALVEETAERTWAAVERARAVSALRASEEKYRSLFDRMGEGFTLCGVIRDAEGRVSDLSYIVLNRALEQQTGLDRRELIGKRLSDILPPVVVERWMSYYARAADGREAVTFGEYAENLDRWYEVSVYPQAEGTQLAIFYRDVTSRKRAEVTLRENQERQAFLLKLSDALRPLGDAVEIKATACCVLGEALQVNRAFYAEVEGDDWLVTRHYEQRVAALQDGAHSAGTYGRWIMETYREAGRIVFRDTRSDPRFAPAEREAHAAAGIISAVGIPLVKNGRLAAILAVHRTAPHEWTDQEIGLIDETAERTWAAVERANAEAALRVSEERLRRLNEQLEERVRERTAEVRSLFQRLVSAQEEERRRIARDIHDQLGQQMTALRMNLDAWRAKADGDPTVHEQADRTQRLAEELDQSVDFLTWQLRPAALDHLGLSAALRNLVAGWSERFGIAAEYDASRDDGVRLSKDVEANLYRIVQEALHNVAKHAQATHVSVSMECRDHELIVVVEDDGEGFAPPPRFDGEGQRLGLLNMRERATLAGGRLEIESTPGTGSAVFVRIPVVVPESA